MRASRSVGLSWTRARHCAVRVVEPAASDVEGGEARVEPRLVRIERGGGFELLERAIVSAFRSATSPLRKWPAARSLAGEVDADGRRPRRGPPVAARGHRAACRQRRGDRCRDRKKPIHHWRRPPPLVSTKPELRQKRPKSGPLFIASLLAAAGPGKPPRACPRGKSLRTGSRCAAAKGARSARRSRRAARSMHRDCSSAGRQRR
jgi:hypothetical protein